MKKETGRTSQERIRQIVEELKSHNITKQDLLLNFLQEEETLSRVFDSQTIETLEMITKHLKEIKKIKIKPSKIIGGYSVPIAILSDRKLSALEHIIAYLKEYHELSYKEIATLLNRDQRTIWTTYQRTKKKRG